MRFVAPIILIFCATAAGQTLPAGARAELEKDLKQIQEEVAGYPAIRLESIEQALSLGIVDGMVDAHTRLNSQSSDVQLVIPGHQSVLRMTFHGRRSGQTGERSFTLLDRDLTNPQKGTVYTSIGAHLGRVFISRDSETPERLSSVQYIQDAPPMPGEVRQELPCRLYVSQSSHAAEQPTITFTLMAPDFITLRRQNRAVLDQYLRPILRDLHQSQAIFSVPSIEAMQVLTLDLVPDAALIDRIQAMLPRLDSENFRQREQAADAIRQMGPAAVMALRNVDHAGLSLQQASAIHALISESTLIPPDEARKLADDRSFLIDVLYSDDPALRKMALDRLGKLTGKSVTLDPDLDAPARNAAIGRLREQLRYPSTQPATAPAE